MEYFQTHLFFSLHYTMAEKRPRHDEPGPAKKRTTTTTNQPLSDDQQEAARVAKTGRNIFITGGAGTGKTHALSHIINTVKGRAGVYITASTGIAAVNIGGTTLHYFAGIGLGAGTAESLLKKVRNNPPASRRWKQCKILIIDEISMVTSDLFTKLDHIGQKIRRKPIPFGGIQLIVCGDFLQLPPVVIDAYPKAVPYCFESSSWKDCNFATHVLTAQHRQANSAFAHILNDIRVGTCPPEAVAALNKRVGAHAEGKCVRLFATNAAANMVNTSHLQKLEKAEHVFAAVDSGKPALLKMMDKHCRAPSELKLKIGARVILLKNYPRHGLVNGSLGVVVNFLDGEDTPQVDFDRGGLFTVKPDTWNIETEGTVQASRTQIPLCLAWALTIHKSQGMTIDLLEVNLRGSFASGQVYVALSRASSLEGLTIGDAFDPSLIHANSRALAFYEKINPQ